jgi:hypothetical protein
MQDTELQDTRTDDLVTEEMVEAFLRAANQVAGPSQVIVGLRAVAPMIRREVMIPVNYAIASAVAAERERCAQMAGHLNAHSVAAAIRARGETT